jgi:aminopeptidase N
MIRFYSELFGPYPFDTYGIALIPDVPGGLETQGLAIVGVPFPSLLAHELAHQWFGNHVSIVDWKETWLNEGLVTYATWLWSEHSGDTTVAEAASTGYDLMSETQLPPPGDPSATDVFNQSVYVRGALTIHALRTAIGDDRLFTLIQEWIDRYGGTSASTEDFIALAEEVSETDLGDLFDGWLYQPTMPPLPGN